MGDSSYRVERKIEVKIRLFGAMNGGCVLVLISLLFGVGCLSALSTCLHTNTKVVTNYLRTIIIEY